MKTCINGCNSPVIAHQKCNKCYQKWHYKQNTKRYKEKAHAYKEKTKDFVRNIKHEGFCEICGEDHFATLVFHHIDPETKRFNISVGDIHDYGPSIQTIKEEIEKCQLLCANCHRKIHYSGASSS